MARNAVWFFRVAASQHPFGRHIGRSSGQPRRGGRPCIRGLRISVFDVLSMLSSGMSQQEVLEDFRPPSMIYE